MDASREADEPSHLAASEPTQDAPEAEPDSDRTSHDEDDPPRPASFTAAEKRLLLVTFYGTVAANIVTAVFIGLAIGLARLFASGEPGRKESTGDVVLLLVCDVMAVAYVYALPGMVKSYTGARRVYVIVGAVLLVLLGIIETLVLIGLAAGLG